MLIEVYEVILPHLYRGSPSVLGGEVTISLAGVEVRGNIWQEKIGEKEQV